MPLGFETVLPLIGGAGGTVDDVYLGAVLADPVCHGDMAQGYAEGQHVTALEAGGNSAFCFNQVRIGLETVFRAGFDQQAFVIRAPAFDIELRILFSQLIRLNILACMAHALQGVAQGEDGAAGFFQGTAVLFGVYLVMPPAVFLAVDHVLSLLSRRNAGNGDGDADGFRILFAVDDDRGQGVFRFRTGAEGSREVAGFLFAFEDDALRRAQFITHTRGAFPVRDDGNIHIFSHFRVFRRKGDLCFREGGGAKQRQQQNCQTKDRFSESVHVHFRTVPVFPFSGPAQRTGPTTPVLYQRAGMNTSNAAQDVSTTGMMRGRCPSI